MYASVMFGCATISGYNYNDYCSFIYSVLSWKSSKGSSHLPQFSGRSSSRCLYTIRRKDAVCLIVDGPANPAFIVLISFQNFGKSERRECDIFFVWQSGAHSTSRSFVIGIL